MSTCTFCKRHVGDGTHDRMLEIYEAMGKRTLGDREIDFHELADRLREQPNRKVQLVLPGPGDIAICDICVDLYAETVRRELAARW